MLTPNDLRMEGFPDFLYPVSHILFYLVLILEYRRRKRTSTLPDYDNHGYAMWLIAVFLFVAVISIAIAAYDAGGRIEPYRIMAKQILAIVMTGGAILYLAGKRWRADDAAH